MVRRSILPLVVYPAVLAALFVAGCGDNYVGPDGCVSDAECLSPRVCFAGACVDPGTTDAALDGSDVAVDADDTSGDVTLPDVPPPRLCLSLDPVAVDFGVIEVGEVTRRTVAVENCGRVDVTVTDVVVPDRSGTFDVENGEGFALPPGAVERVVVVARGVSEGVITNDLLVVGPEIGDVRAGLSVTVGAAAGRACVRVAPVTPFGALSVGATSETLVFVENCGDTDLAIDAVGLAGPDAAAFEVTDASLLDVIPVGESGAARVAFTPTEARSFEASLQVIDITGASDEGVLFGSGEPDVPLGCLQTSTDLVDFGDRQIGERGAAIVTLTNCGELDLELAEPTLSGDRGLFGVDGVPPALGAGESVDLTVSTNARAAGDASASLRFDATDGRTAPAIVDLRVTVTQPLDACLTFEPPRLDLGRVPIDGSRSGVVNLVNCGDLALTLSNVAFEGADTFELAADFPDLIGPGQRVPLTFVAFGTDPLGPRAGRFELGQPGIGVTASVALAAEVVADGADRCIDVLPPAVDFGSVPVGEVAFEGVTVVNCGSTDELLERADLAAGPFSITVPPFALSPGAEVFFEARFQPTRAGTASRSWRLQTDDGTLWGPWSLTGEGVAAGEACLTFEPPLVSFGEVPFGEGVAFDREVRLVNCGTAPLVVDAFEPIAGRAFELGGAAPTPLDPGESLSMPVFFAPPSPGRFTGSWVAVAFTAEGLVIEAELGLEAVATEADDVCVRAVPDALDFGEVPAGSARTRTTVIENCGGEPLALRSFGIDGARYSAPLTLPPVLAPGARVEVPVTLRSDAPGDVVGRLAVVFEPDAAVSVDLFGVIVDGVRGPWIRVEPTELDYGTLASGSSTTRNVRVCNDGDETLQILDVDLAEGDPRVWSFSPPADALIEPGGCTSFTARFAPRGVPAGERDTFAGVLTIRSNARNLPTVNVSLRGVGLGDDTPLEPCFEPLDAIGRGSATVGTSGRIEVRYRNCGDVALRVTDLTLSRPSGAGVTWEVSDVTVEPGERLAPGATMVVGILFSGTAEGIYRGTVTVDTDRLTPVAVPVEAIVDEGAERCFRPETEFIDLGDLLDGDVVEVPVFFVNCGETPIRLDEAFVESTPGLAVDVDTPWIPGELLRPGDVVEVFVLVEAVRVGPAEALLFVETDSGGAEVVLAATVLGEEPLPCIEVTPGRYDLGTLTVGASARRTVEVVNCGDVPLDVFDASFRRGVLGYAVTGTSRRLPTSLAPGEPMVVTAEFTARTEGRIVDDLVIRSSDPDRPAVSVRFSATVVDETVCPDAVAGVSRSLTGPFAPALSTIAGTRLYLDPGLGGGIAGAVEWEPVEFPGRAPVLEGTGVSGRVTFVPTDLGDYAFRVFWALDDGCTGEGLVTIDVSRDSGVGEGLRIVATWRTPGDPDELEDPGSDIDLHLARVTPRGLRWNSNQDCYYANRTPSWGGDADTGNDPRLLRDEVDGLGPEIIVLEDPNETYYVGVYYFSDSGFGASEVTLRFYFDGIEFASATRTLERTGRFWLAAAVEDGGSVRLLDRPNDNGFTPAGVMP